jgi:hypothetical protein
MVDTECTRWYAAYAADHDLEPSAMRAADRERWPGGQMAGFTIWMAAKHAAFGVPVGLRPLTDDEMVAFDTFVTTGLRQRNEGQ